MNLLFLSETIYPHRGGAALATYLWAESLAKSGFNIKIVTNKFPNEPKISKHENMTIYRIPLLKSQESTKYSILRRFNVLFSNFIRKLLVWSDVVYIPRFWYTAIPMAKVWGKAVVVHLHDYIPICPLTTRYNIFENEICNSWGLCHPSCILAHERAHGKSFSWTLKSSLLNLSVWPFIGRLIGLSNAVICVSNAQRNMITTQVPSLAQKCQVIYNPMPQPSENEINGEDMGYFGGPNPLKGFNVLCSALKRVKNEVTIHAAAFNMPSQCFVRSSKSRIIFYEWLSGEHYEKIYRQINTVIIPSVCLEALPYVVCEALLSRRLVIASKAGGIPELVEGCPGAFLFQPGDHKCLAEIIDYVNNLDKHTILDLGDENKKAFLKRFNNERSLKEFSDLIKRLNARTKGL